MYEGLYDKLWSHYGAGYYIEISVVDWQSEDYELYRGSLDEFDSNLFKLVFRDPGCFYIIKIKGVESDLLEVLEAAVTGELDQVQLKWSRKAALTVVMAVNGYPGSYEKGSEIKGIDVAEAGGVTVFHAGTKVDGERILANGGRVLNVTALAPTVSKAQAEAYDAVTKIDWPEGFCRSDIGWRAIDH